MIFFNGPANKVCPFFKYNYKIKRETDIGLGLKFKFFEERINKKIDLTIIEFLLI